MDDYFFTLAPANDAAVAVVMANAHFAHEGVLVFAANFVVKGPKLRRLFRQGQQYQRKLPLPIANHFVFTLPTIINVTKMLQDVILPSHTAYRNDHFAFFLAPSGELILRDRSEGALSLWIEGVPDHIYGLSGKTIRQRVIPRVNSNVHIVCGNNSTRLEFTLRWNRQCLSVDSAEIQAALAAQAHRRLGENTPFQPPNTYDRMAAHRAQLAALQGSSATRQSGHTPRSYFQPSFNNAPNIGVAQRLGKRKDVHRYHRLGEGAFGVVSKAVDLATGEIWALKELKEGASLNNKNHAKTFKSEVESLAMLDHPNITQLESFQDFKLGSCFQIFYVLHHGNVSSLIRDHLDLHGHNCCANAPPPPIWAPRFIEQTTSAMAYLISQNVLHRDLKPDNILFDRDSSGEVTNFYISDFGLASMAGALNRWRGTSTFVSPELITEKASESEATDMWAFGITLGHVLGYWCYRPSCLSTLVEGSSIEAMAAAVSNSAPHGYRNQPSVEQTLVQNTGTGQTIIHNPNTGHTIVQDPNTGQTIFHDRSTGQTIGLDPNTGQRVALDPNIEHRVAANLHPVCGPHYRRTRAIMSLVQHGVLPPAFRCILDRPEARPRFENCKHWTAETFLVRSIENVNHPVWSFAELYR